MRKILGLSAAVLLAATSHGFAQSYIRVPTCGAAAPPAGAGQGYMDSTGNICTSATASGSGTTVTPGSLTQVPLDVATVTTGGTAVTALTAGHRNKGGWLQNPVGATIALCVNEIGTASGTTSSGNTTCIQPGQSYSLSPSTSAVSVISSDNSHPFSGMGLN